MYGSTSKLSVVCLLWITLFALPILAQTGSIQGTVVDSQGQVIVGATVRSVDSAKGIVIRQTASSGDGSFLLQPLQPGIYTIRVSSKGMKDLVRPNVNLDQNQVLGLGQLMMSVGAAAETVTVEATTPLVETASADHSSVIDSRQILETSMNGRDFQSLVRTLPGVVSADPSDFRLAFNNTDSFQINGMRGSNNNVYLDGAVNTDVGANDGQYTQLSMDAVGEFKIQTSNFAAEYGRNPGVLLAVNTKSGGQQFHGTVYEFNRENGFDANYYFNKFQPDGVTPITPPTPNSELRFNQYGFNVGGPIPLLKLSTRKNPKMFFFFNFEGTKALKPSGGQSYTLPNRAFLGIGTTNGEADFSSLLVGSPNFTYWDATCPYSATSVPQGTVFMPGTVKLTVGTATIPAGQVSCGNPFPNNKIPTSMFSKQYQGWVNMLSPFYAKAHVDPNNPWQEIVQFQDTYTFNKHQEVVRYDWNINAKTNFFFRWVDDSQREAKDFQLFAWGTFPALPNHRKKPGSSWSWNLVNVISPTVTNEFIFGYNHLTQVVDVNTTPAHYDKNLLGFTYQDMFPTANIRNLMPQFSAGGGGINSSNPLSLSSYFFAPGWTSEARTFTWTDNLTKVSGPHTLKFGAFFDYNQAGQAPSYWESPVFTFDDSAGDAGTPGFLNTTHNGMANLLLGNYQNVTQGNGNHFGQFRFHQFELYGQDTWKVNRKLTLDYGLRWAYLGPTYSVKPILEYYFDPKAYNPAQAVTIDTRATNLLVSPIIVNGSICSISNPCPGVTNYGNPYNGMIQENTAGYPPGFVDHRYRNIEPRLGFAYDPSGTGKWAIRGGFGIFHERVRQNANSFDALGNPPVLYQPVIYNGNIDQTSPALVAGGLLSPVGILTPGKDGHIPTTYSWSIGVQHQLPWQIGLDVAYVGNRARHLQYQYNLDQLPVGTTAGPGSICPNATCTWLAALPYTGYSYITATSYGANSEYNALQIKATRRFSKTLTLSTDYTYAHNRDLADGDYTGDIRDAFHPKLDYGPSGWDFRHVFNFNYVYDFPTFSKKSTLVRLLLGGWESSGVIRAWSGSPFSLFCGGNSGTFNSSSPFCDYVGGPMYLKKKTTVNGVPGYYWINPAAFQINTPGTLGNTTRNEFRGPGYQNWNLSIFKNFDFKENLRLQLRLETFNTFNHVQFAQNTSGDNTSSNGGINNSPGAYFGIPGGTRDPRQVQLGAKLYF
jgi:hypothetical protein